MNLSFIRIPLYKLNYVSTIEEIDLNENFLNQFRKEYDAEERKGIFEQLDWSVKNSGYDFNSLVDTNAFSNYEIYKYIERLHKFMLENKVVEN